VNISRLSSLAISDSGFIFDPVTGGTFTTNEIGIKIIRSLKDNMEPIHIISEVVEEFEVDFEEAEMDVIDYVRKLKTYNLIIDEE